MTSHPITWFAVRSRPQAEIPALAGLKERGFEVFLPMERRLRRTPKGRVTVEHPLIPGYLFVGVKDWGPGIHEAEAVTAIRQVVRFANGEPAPIPTLMNEAGEEVHFVYALQALCASGAFDFTPRLKTFEPDEKVKITGGLFVGHIGQIVTCTPGERARVMLSGLFASKEGTLLDVDHLEAA